jgi:glycosyltransferase involved in cell wall biosynthesis
MTTLRVIIDDMLARTPNGISRYTEELTRALITYAPTGCTVEGIVSASTGPEYANILAKLPELTGVYKSPLARRELVAAWQHGFTRIPGGGMIHATSLVAPLSRHDRLNDAGHQIAVTIHDVNAWTHPSSYGFRRVSWHKTMVQRAYKYADAIIVPSHAVADQLSEIVDCGERVRVIGGAVSSSLALPSDAAARAKALSLPKEYILAMGGLEPRRGITMLLEALALPGASTLPLLIVGPDDSTTGAVASAATAAGLPEGRVRSIAYLDDPDLAVVLANATMLVVPSLAEGFSLPVLEAFQLGTPVIHSDAPAIVETAGGAGIAVPLDDLDGYPARLSDAINRVDTDEKLAANLSTSGLDRAGLFNWRTSAEKVWQLHADL